MQTSELVAGRELDALVAEMMGDVEVGFGGRREAAKAEPADKFWRRFEV
jgi:hypothetical protein